MWRSKYVLRKFLYLKNIENHTKAIDQRIITLTSFQTKQSWVSVHVHFEMMIIFIILFTFYFPLSFFWNKLFLYFFAVSSYIFIQM